MIVRTILLIGVFMALAADAFATGNDTVAGVWWMPRHNGKIKIEIDDRGVADGRLIALEPRLARRIDQDNPDKSLRRRPVLGVVVLRGFTPDENGVWRGGTLYDPNSGSIYTGTLSLDPDGNLLMRGSVLFGLIGRTMRLARVPGLIPNAEQSGEPELIYAAQQ